MSTNNAVLSSGRAEEGKGLVDMTELNLSLVYVDPGGTARDAGPD